MNMHRSVSVLAMACWLLFGQSAYAAENATQSQLVLGKRVYDGWCVTCHGPGPGRSGGGLTGTEALEAKYAGKVPAVLDERKDLTPDFVSYFVRNGASVMPFFRKTEITDDELAALSAYLSRLNAGLKPK